MPSLNKLSPSRIIVNRLSMPICRKRAITETGSVADTIAPKSRAVWVFILPAKCKIAATPTMQTTTPTVARTLIDSQSRRRALMSMFHEASKSNAGKNMSSTISGVIETGGKTLESPITSPAITSATAYGTRIHLITTAVAEATRSSAKSVSR